ncbi:hypothetical protein [Croceitalea rosinachiae]|uniref:Uncharacterized protein n=1 Tax=Croceitalea rosinachiae TaxID=3075596 RepID=A0ABU3ADG0_9FLAO|nr:hypothetical protein [Croceitalea sp. F388]MDT0608024.1 hypothetical protein [Croceitalea sp. F388]
MNLDSAQIKDWIAEVIESGEGAFKIKNKGTSYIEYNNGRFLMKHLNVVREVKKTKEVTIDIFNKRVGRYLNFEYKRYYYYFYDGDWYRQKL